MYTVCNIHSDTRTQSRTTSVFAADRKNVINASGERSECNATTNCRWTQDDNRFAATWCRWARARCVAATARRIGIPILYLGRRGYTTNAVTRTDVADRHVPGVSEIIAKECGARRTCPTRRIPQKKKNIVHE